MNADRHIPMTTAALLAAALLASCATPPSSGPARPAAVEPAAANGTETPPSPPRPAPEPTPAARPAPPLSQAAARLGAAAFSERETAEAELVRQGDIDPQATLDRCLEDYSRTSDPEIRFRLGRVMETLVGRHVYRPARGFLGLLVQLNLTVPAAGQIQRSLQVMQVVAGSEAEKAGFQVGDRILKIGELDCTALETTEQFVNYVRARPVGGTLDASLARGDGEIKLTATVGTIPPDHPARQKEDEEKARFFRTWLETRMPPRAPDEIPPPP